MPWLSPLCDLALLVNVASLACDCGDSVPACSAIAEKVCSLPFPTSALRPHNLLDPVWHEGERLTSETRIFLFPQLSLKSGETILSLMHP